MSQSSSQAHAFYSEVAKTKRVWTIRDEDGFPAPINSTGSRAQPFWSSLRRTQNIIKNVVAYSLFQPVELTWEVFHERWLPGLEKDGVLVGINWTGSSATGFDLDSKSVKEAVEAQIAILENA